MSGEGVNVPQIEERTFDDRPRPHTDPLPQAGEGARNACLKPKIITRSAAPDALP
jgi:hypothetical protein